MSDRIYMRKWASSTTSFVSLLQDGSDERIEDTSGNDCTIDGLNQ